MRVGTTLLTPVVRAPPLDAGRRTINAVKALSKPGSSEGWVNAGPLISRLRQEDPEFDVRAWGYDNAQDFLRHILALDMYYDPNPSFHCCNIYVRLKRKASSYSSQDVPARRASDSDVLSQNDRPTPDGDLGGRQCGNVMLSQVRKTQRTSIERQRLLQGSARYSAVKVVLSRAEAVLSTSAPDDMVDVFIHAVGLLAAPRTRACRTTGVTMNAEARGRLQLAQQMSLRAVMLRLLGSEGSAGLDLSDKGTMKLLDVPFACIRGLLNRKDLDGLQSKQQWLSLATLIGMKSQSLQQEESHLSENPNKKRRYERKTQMVQERGYMGRAVQAAFALGDREATAEEILRRIISTPAILDEIRPHVNRAQNKHCTRNQDEVWMANLRGNFGRWCLNSGEKRDGKFLWKLKDLKNTHGFDQSSRFLHNLGFSNAFSM